MTAKQDKKNKRYEERPLHDDASAGKDEKAPENDGDEADEDEADLDEDEANEDEDEADEDEGRQKELAGKGKPGSEDRYWWSPHAVLGAMLLVGLLGASGLLSKPLSFLAPKGAPSAATAVTPPAVPNPAVATPRPSGLRPRPNLSPRDTFGGPAK